MTRHRAYDPDVKPGCLHRTLLLAAACAIGWWRG